MSEREETPNDPKLSDCGGRHGACADGGTNAAQPESEEARDAESTRRDSRSGSLQRIVRRIYGVVGHFQSIRRSAPYVRADAITRDRIHTRSVQRFIPSLVSGSQKFLSHLVGNVFALFHSPSLSGLSLKAGNVFPSLETSNGTIKPRCSRIVKIFQATVSGILSVSLAGFRAVKSCHSQYCGSSRCFQIHCEALANSSE